MKVEIFIMTAHILGYTRKEEDMVYKLRELCRPLLQIHGAEAL